MPTPSRGPVSATSSPRTRRLSRPLPAFTSIPTSAAAFSFPSVMPQSNQDAPWEPPLAPAYFREKVHEVQGTLYGGRGRDREEVKRVVGELYDGGASFENPLTLARGKEAISDMFALLALVPGTMWSEMGDVTESQGYDGNRLLVFTHTLHISLLPYLDSESRPHLSGAYAATPSRRRSYSFFSLPATPYAQTPSATYPSVDSETPTQDRDDLRTTPGIFSKTHPADGTTRWPTYSLLSLLNPKSIASAVTTLHIKLHTRLLFNDEGRIIAHEDLWGVKELVEGVFPIVGHLYSINRQGLAWAAGWASRALFAPRSDAATKEAEKQRLTGKEDLEAAYLTPEMGSRKSLRPLNTAFDGSKALPSNGLGLVEVQKAVPTTMMDVESGGE
ncbi:hypothetical protein JCM11641_007910 [Rhodosporidiobolus odoratus]